MALEVMRSLPAVNGVEGKFTVEYITPKYPMEYL
jgi:hypothetical protein